MRRNLKLAALVAALVCLSQLANASVPQSAPSWDFMTPTPRIVTAAPSWDFTLTTAEVCVLPTAATEWNFDVDTESVNADKVAKKSCTDDCPCPRKDCGEGCPCCGNPSDPDLTYEAAYERAKAEQRYVMFCVGQTAKTKAEKRAEAKSKGWLFAAEDSSRVTLPPGVHEFGPPVVVPIVQQSFAMPACSGGSCGMPAYQAYAMPSYGGGCSNGQCSRR